MECLFPFVPLFLPSPMLPCPVQGTFKGPSHSKIVCILLFVVFPLRLSTLLVFNSDCFATEPQFFPWVSGLKCLCTQVIPAVSPKSLISCKHASDLAPVADIVSLMPALLQSSPSASHALHSHHLSWLAFLPHGPATPGSHCPLVCFGFSLTNHEVVSPRKACPVIPYLPPSPSPCPFLSPTSSPFPILCALWWKRSIFS